MSSLPREDIAALVTVLTMVVIGAILGWIGNRYRWGYRKGVLFIWLLLALLFGTYLFIVKAPLWQILLYVTGFFLLAQSYLVFGLVLGTAIGKAL